ncbi:uncharacterized protein RCC_01480 [Ramularia collo-cygni]|uniref:Rhodopsin domain-containing protein n=1 Tax=Ramularia collo-cygni TaxID=112498 RepID=A0A2D3UMR9_9PEZI|nr:uncharacterized protein RCC_01480 [Ramularia collo-cygni]CZT15641.1 uncharacterized protein RCC_01480 [Ramularia collo-cygni]
MSTAFSYAVSEADASLANWICGSLALAILTARLVGHRWQHSRLDLSAYLVIMSIVVLIARIICNTVVLRDKTIRTSQQDSTNLRTGSIVTLITRILVTTFYWLQCTLLLVFYRDMLDHMTWIARIIKSCWIFMACTYITVVLVTFLECRPIRLYWTMDDASQPHTCTKAYGQLFTQCISIAIIDSLLLVISAPILRSQIRQFPRNLQLGLLYTLGFFSLIVIGFRLHFIHRDGSAQRARSFWASIQVVTATFVANAPSIYGACKNVRRRKESVDSLARARTRTQGSDESYGREEVIARVAPAARMRL